jgi:hypothetical protein
MSKFEVGSGFRLSELGMKRCGKFKSRTGRIVSISPTGSSVRVVMEGRRQPLTLHESYVEPVPEQTHSKRFQSCRALMSSNSSWQAELKPRSKSMVPLIAISRSSKKLLSGSK